MGGIQNLFEMPMVVGCGLWKSVRMRGVPFFTVHLV